MALISGGIFQMMMAAQSLWQNMLIQPVVLILLKLLAYSVMINLVLAIFNLIPIPPLDGGRIVTTLLPPRARENFAGLSRSVFNIDPSAVHKFS
ncbi:MAG: site-2 protease family protein [Desulfobacterales bacterium]